MRRLRGHSVTVSAGWGLISLLPLIMAAVLFSSCAKKEDEAALQKKKEMALSTFSEERTGIMVAPAPLPSGQKIEVPPEVKAKFHTVKMAVGNRQTKEEKEFPVKIGGSAEVPGSPYKIEVQAYLPHWALRGDTVISKGVDPVDPAVRAIITENGKKVFDGFIFQRHITPSFFTEKYVITLTGAS